MKKIVTALLFAFLIFVAFLKYEKSSYIKIFKINFPNEIYLDLNKNLIFDEQEPFKINNLYSVTDYKDQNISGDIRFLFEYFAMEEAKALTKNSYAQVKNSELFINGKNYRELLLKKDFFYDNTQESKQKFSDNLNKYNPDDYVIVNLKSNKYHKINCDKAKEIKHFKILHSQKLTEKYTKAKCCFDNIKTKLYSPKVVNNSSNLNYTQGNIKVYFINLNSVSVPNNECKTDACKVLKTQIDNAKSSIDFAIYGFNNEPEIYNSLKNAKERGVKIRWVTNYDSSNDIYYPDLQILKELLPDFTSNDNSQNGLMHNKFFIFDNKFVYTGSANISATDLSGFNSNYVVLIESDKVANIYKQEFEQLYSGHFSNNKTSISKNPVIFDDGTEIQILFSPKDLIINNYIVKLIDNAKTYIYMPSFFITDKNLKAALINAKARNVDIKIINDATSASSKYSKHNELRDNGILVKTENFAGKMHSKSIIIDDKYTVIGSMNYTSSGNKRNDENVLIIKNSEITKYMKKTFNDVWKNIPDKYLKFDPRPESFESIGSCQDNIDNDFDNKIDLQDEGCIIKQYRE